MRDRRHPHGRCVDVFATTVVIVAACAWGFPSPAHAAALYFGSPSAEVAVDERVEVGVFLDTRGESINAVEGVVVTFPRDAFAVEGFRDPGSIVNVWLDRPSLDERGVAFSGITPGGFTGERGYLFSLILRPRALGDVVLSTEGESLLRNDGAGTAASVERAPLRLTVVERASVPGFEPSFDRDPPEPFTIEIARDPNGALFEGRWFAVFLAADKGVGIDRYEVLEQRGSGPPGGTWVIAESPYALRDQARRSTLFVRAIDHAGNERLAALPPDRPLRWYERYAVRWAVVVVALIACVVGLIVRQWKRRVRNVS